MADSLEYKTVLSCFDKLVTALKLDPLAVSNELVAEGLIPPVDGSVKAQELAQLLRDAIQLSPKRYYDVLKVFSGHEWLGAMVEILQEKHGELEGVARVGVQIQGSEEAHTESMSKLSISSKELAKLVEGECDDSFKLELDCPHKQSSLPVPNPIVRFEDLTEDDREDLFAQMDELTKEIFTQFKKVQNQVYKSLTEHVKHKEVVETLTGYDTMIFDDDDKLDEAKDMFDVFKTIRPHLSYFNYNLLKLLVDVHGTPDDEKCFDEYLKSFASYCQAMPCAEEICGSDDSRPKRIKIMFKLNFDRQRLKADYVKDIIRNIARILKIKPSSLYLRSIKEGCVSLEFLVPAFLFDRIFPLADAQILSLYSEVKVTAIQCDQRNLHVDVETLAQPLIQQKEFKSTLKVDIGFTPGSQATSGHSTGASSSGYSSCHSSDASSKGYPLMQPPKEFRHFPEEYQRVAYRSQSFAPHPLHRLHKVEELRSVSFAPRPLHIGPTGTGPTTSSAASSGYFSSASSMGSGYQVMETPKRFDYASFSDKLSEVKERDPQWKQFWEEFRHHDGEYDRLYWEVVQLERQKYEAKDKESKKDIELKLKLKELERDLTMSKRNKAGYQLWQRGCELERDLLLQELKKATNDDMKIEIQRRLEEAEGKIREWKKEVNVKERQVNEYEESIAQLRKESPHLGSADPLPSKLSPEDKGHDIPVLKTDLPSISITSTPASSSPATAHYTCPSCSGQYQGGKGLYSGEERSASCSGSDGGKQQTN